MKKICVLGLGYIGLPTGAILASKGFKIIGVDINFKVVKRLNSKDIENSEPGLANLVKRVISSGNLKAQTIPEEADVFIICVPTPLTDEKKADLTYVKSVAKSILPYLKKDNLVILESTVPPGTTQKIIKPILEESSLKVGSELYLAYCPERVIPGNILKEIVNNDRIIGGVTQESAELAKEVAKDADCLILLVDHKEFRELEPDEFLKEMRHKIIIDTRGVWKSYG